MVLLTSSSQLQMEHIAMTVLNIVLDASSMKLIPSAIIAILGITNLKEDALRLVLKEQNQENSQTLLAIHALMDVRIAYLDYA